MLKSTRPQENIEDTDYIYNSLVSLGYGSSHLKAIARPDAYIPGISGFLFDITEDETLSAKADITEHYTEDNVAIQDHVAVKPTRFTVTGNQGELVSSLSPTDTTVKQTITQLDFIEEYITPITVGNDDGMALKKLNSPSKVLVSSAYTMFNSMAINNPYPRQAWAFNYLYQLLLGRMYFTVETPWGVLRNMMIESIDAIQSKDTAYKSSIKVTFVQVRMAGEVQIVEGQLIKRTADKTTQQNAASSNVAGNPVASTPASVTEAATAFKAAMEQNGRMRS